MHRKILGDYLNELSEYSKEDILEALGQSLNAERTAKDMVSYLGFEKKRRLLDQYGRILKEEASARKALLKWSSDMCSKYGNEKTVLIKDIPGPELTKGATLERMLRDKLKEERAIKQAVINMLGGGNNA